MQSQSSLLQGNHIIEYDDGQIYDGVFLDGRFASGTIRVGTVSYQGNFSLSRSIEVSKESEYPCYDLLKLDQMLIGDGVVDTPEHRLTGLFRRGQFIMGTVIRKYTCTTEIGMFTSYKECIHLS